MHQSRKDQPSFAGKSQDDGTVESILQGSLEIMQGKLTETDARRRHTILNYCEHFRTAYTTKDLDFLKQVFSDKALIIVGNVIKPVANDNKCQAEAK